MMLRGALNANEVAKKVEKKSLTKFEPMGLNPLKKSIFLALLANFTSQFYQTGRTKMTCDKLRKLMLGRAVKTFAVNASARRVCPNKLIVTS